MGVLIRIVPPEVTAIPVAAVLLPVTPAPVASGLLTPALVEQAASKRPHTNALAENLLLLVQSLTPLLLDVRIVLLAKLLTCTSLQIVIWDRHLVVIV